MFVRQNKNKSGSICVQIISKSNVKYKVVKSFGSSTSSEVILEMILKAKQEIKRLEATLSLFVLEKDVLIELFLCDIENAQIRAIGSELVFGRIFDYIGFNVINEELFRYLVIALLAFPLSKLKTIEYLYRYQGVRLEISAVLPFFR